MSNTREFTIQMEDRPGAFAKACRSLADRRVNILAFQAFPISEGKSLVRFVVDNPANAKTALDTEGLKFTETEVAQVKLPHRRAHSPKSLRISARQTSTSNMDTAGSIWPMARHS